MSTNSGCIGKHSPQMVSFGRGLLPIQQAVIPTAGALQPEGGISRATNAARKPDVMRAGWPGSLPSRDHHAVGATDADCDVCCFISRFALRNPENDLSHSLSLNAIARLHPGK